MRLNKSVFIVLLIGLGFISSIQAQESNKDAFFIKQIFDQTLTQGACYDWLFELSENIGGRLAGSPGAAAAVEYTSQIIDTLEVDRKWLEPCKVPHWVRGEPEEVHIVESNFIGGKRLAALALGNSVGTPPEGITAEVVEVTSLDDLEKLGKAGLNGKIAFFNRPLDPTQVNVFNAYGGAVDQRVWGASKASKYGAVAALVRSMTTSIDNVPHTGVSIYEEGVRKIPSIAISTMAAEELSTLLKAGDKPKVRIKASCATLPDKDSYNVIGEIKGSEFPDEIILVGGHLDSWDVGGGAHDDGAGCVHAMQVLQTLKALNYKPKRTIRCVLFMNEENGLKGATTYWANSDSAKEFHMAAIESDAGGFTPRGFSCDAEKDIFDEKFIKAKAWFDLLSPYGLDLWKGGSGADISGLKKQRGMLFGLRPDPQRYFDFHHTAVDNIDAVNKRELELGAAAMTSLVFLIDKYGI